MSYVEIYAFDQKGYGYLYGEVKNSWLGAPAIWRYMEERYLPPFVPEGMTLEDVQRVVHKPSRLQSIDTMKEIWALADHPEVAESDRIVLATTFDQYLVRKEELPRLIAAFQEFFPFKDNQNLRKQAEILKNANDDPDVIAIGWNQTSINGSTWDNNGGFDYEKEVAIPYNCLTGTEHYWLFEELYGR